MAKSFKKSAAEAFITNDDNNQVTPTFEIPDGFRLVRERKSERMNLLVRDNTKKALKRLAIMDGISLNELVNRIFDEYISKREDI